MFENVLPDLKSPLDVVSPTDSYDFAFYTNDTLQYSQVPFLQYDNPKNAWTSAFVTSHHYKVSFGYGLDMSQISIQLSELWAESDKDIMFHFNNTVFKENATAYLRTVKYENQVVSDALGDLKSMLDLHDYLDNVDGTSGYNYYWNETDDSIPLKNRYQVFSLLMNGKADTKDSNGITEVVVKFMTCYLYCPKLPVDINDDLSGTYCNSLDNERYWSNPASWNHQPNKPPIAGDSVYIPRYCKYIIDVDTPVFE